MGTSESQRKKQNKTEATKKNRGKLQNPIRKQRKTNEKP